jgi:hypothetical protein
MMMMDWGLRASGSEVVTQAQHAAQGRVQLNDCRNQNGVVLLTLCVSLSEGICVSSPFQWCFSCC